MPPETLQSQMEKGKLFSKPICFGLTIPLAVSVTVFGVSWLGAPKWVEPDAKQNTFTDEIEEILKQEGETAVTLGGNQSEVSFAVLSESLEGVETHDANIQDEESVDNPAVHAETPRNLSSSNIIRATDTEYKILLDRYEKINGRIHDYVKMANFFYRLQFSLIWAATLSAIMLAVTAGGSFLGAYSNNNETNYRATQFLRTLFLSTTAMSLLFFNLPGILKLGDNRKASWLLVKELSNLSNKMDAFVITGGTTAVNSEAQPEFRRMDMNRFIHYVDQELDRLHQLPVDFNQSVISDIGTMNNSIIPQRPSE